MKKKEKKLIRLKCKIDDLIYKMEGTVVRNCKGDWLGHKDTAFIKYERIERKLSNLLESKILPEEISKEYLEKIKVVQDSLPFLDNTTK